MVDLKLKCQNQPRTLRLKTLNFFLYILTKKLNYFSFLFYNKKRELFRLENYIYYIYSKNQQKKSIE